MKTILLSILALMAFGFANAQVSSEYYLIGEDTVGFRDDFGDPEDSIAGYWTSSPKYELEEAEGFLLVYCDSVSPNFEAFGFTTGMLNLTDYPMVSIKVSNLGDTTAYIRMDLQQIDDGDTLNVNCYPTGTDSYVAVLKKGETKDISFDFTGGRTIYWSSENATYEAKGRPACDDEPCYLDLGALDSIIGGLFFVNGGAGQEWQTQFGYYNGVIRIDEFSIGNTEPLGNTDRVNAFSANVFPNPSVSGQLNLEFALEKPSDVKIYMTNVNGANVEIYNNSLYTGPHSFPVDLKKLEKGVYFLNCMIDGVPSFTRKVVIQ